MLIMVPVSHLDFLAPAIYQSVIDIILKNIFGICVYFDILVSGCSEHEHL